MIGKHNRYINLVALLVILFSTYPVHSVYRYWGGWSGEISGYHPTPESACAEFEVYMKRWIPTDGHTLQRGNDIEVYNPETRVKDTGPAYNCAVPDELEPRNIYYEYILFSLLPEDTSKESGPPKCPAGNPINIATGNKYQREVDYRDTGALSIVRSYNSDATHGEVLRPFGIGWTANFLRFINVYKDSMTVVGADGYTEFLTWDGMEWITQPGSKFKVIQTSDGYTVTKGETGRDYYNLDGKLTSEVLKSGRRLTYDYNDRGQLIGVSEEGVEGRGFKIVYMEHKIRGEYFIEKIEGPGDRVSRYTYDPIGTLLSVIYEDASFRNYHYEAANIGLPEALTGISENGKRFASWTYQWGVGNKPAANFSGHASGTDEHALVFNSDGSTTVTNPLGRTTTYHFNEFHGAKKVTHVEGHASESCEGKNRGYTYDANGYMSSKTNWKGISTQYVRDNRGLALSRTEAFGTPEERTITTVWHDDFQLPLKITEPGKITEFTYDAQGHQTSRTVRSNP